MPPPRFQQEYKAAMKTLPSPYPGFMRKKAKILEQLSAPASEYTDSSPKGSVDEGIRELIDGINSHDGLVTTSSCAGRVSVFVEGRKGGVAAPEEADQPSSVKAAGRPDKPASTAGGKGGGGSWLFVSHDPVDLGGCDDPGGRDVASLFGLEIPADQARGLEDAGQAPLRLIHFKFEPMVRPVLVLCWLRISGLGDLSAAYTPSPTPWFVFISTSSWRSYTLALDPTYSDRLAESCPAGAEVWPAGRLSRERSHQPARGETGCRKCESHSRHKIHGAVARVVDRGRKRWPQALYCLTRVSQDARPDSQREVWGEPKEDREVLDSATSCPRWAEGGVSGRIRIRTGRKEGNQKGGGSEEAGGTQKRTPAATRRGRNPTRTKLLLTSARLGLIPVPIPSLCTYVSISFYRSLTNRRTPSYSTPPRVSAQPVLFPGHRPTTRPSHTGQTDDSRTPRPLLAHNLLNPPPLQPPNLLPKRLHLPPAVQRPPVVLAQAPHDLAARRLHRVGDPPNLLPALQPRPQRLHLLGHRVPARRLVGVGCRAVRRRRELLLRLLQGGGFLGL